MDNLQGQPPPWPPQQPSTQYPSSYQQLPQYQRPYFQQLVYYPPPQPMTPYKPKNKTMKTLSIICHCIFFGCIFTVPAFGPNLFFGFIAFLSLVAGFIFLCCI